MAKGIEINEANLRNARVRRAFIECIEAITLYELTVYDIEKSSHIYEAEEEFEALAGVSYFAQIVDRVTIRQLNKFREDYYKLPTIEEKENFFREFYKKSLKKRKITVIKDEDRKNKVD